MRNPDLLSRCSVQGEQRGLHLIEERSATPQPTGAVPIPVVDLVALPKPRQPSIGQQASQLGRVAIHRPVLVNQHGFCGHRRIAAQAKVQVAVEVVRAPIAPAGDGDGRVLVVRNRRAAGRVHRNGRRNGCLRCCLRRRPG